MWLVHITLRGQDSPADSLRTHFLDSVVISDTRKMAFDPGLNPRFTQTGDNQNMAELLTDKKAVFIRSYGPGLLSSISARGTEAVHTPLIWNGFSLQNAVNAINDPAMENTPGNYDVSYLPGGQSGLFGSGAIGGTIQLMPDFGQPMGISAAGGLEFASFGFNREFIRTTYRNNSLSLGANLNMYSRMNTYSFMNRAKPGMPKERMENAAAKGFSFNADGLKKLPKGGKISASVWYQQNRRQIPGTLIAPHKDGIQVDKNLRSMAGWEKSIGKAHFLSIKGALLYDYLFYDDNSLSRPSKMIQYSGLARIEYEYSPHRSHRVFAGINYGYAHVLMSEYEEQKRERHQTTLFVGYKYRLPGGQGEAAVQLTEELWDAKAAPPCPAFSMRIHPLKNLSIRTRINRNFRQPSFNDLYWAPGGNPNLKPETSLSQELGLDWEKKTGNKKISAEYDIQITGFHQTMQNRIVWIPGALFWSPENIDRTRAYGAEADVRITRVREKWKIEGSLHYTFTRSVRSKARFDGDPAYRKQIPYIPWHMASAEISIAYRNSRLFYRHGYTGKRYTLADNSAFLPHYHTGTIGVSQSVTFLGITLEGWFVCENIADIAYEVLAFRPMPGRLFRGGLLISFNKKIPKGIFNSHKNEK
jgi:vitamin B12 transporter